MMFSSDEFDHLKIPLENILIATNNFADGNVIGTGELEKRYNGQLLWSGELIHIRARRFNKDDEIEHMFWTEISMLLSLMHKNVVSLVGFCDENDEKIIITKREKRGSLDNYLSDPISLTWVRRLEISVSIARALSYIHYDEPRDFSVIHRLINSATVLLNDEWEPKLSDFQCSMKIKASERHHSFYTNRLVYENGYGHPTYLETKSVSHKSDIYSFGIVLFELLCGRESIIDEQDNKYLASVAIFHYKKKLLDEIIDPLLWKAMDPQSFNVFVKTAYECLNEERSQRPNIHEIVARLETALKLQLEHEKVEHSVAAAEVEGTSFSHEKNIDPFMRDRILEWLRKERFYRVYLDSEATSALWNGGANLLEAEAMWEQFVVKQRKEKDEAEKSPFDYTFDDAGNRVTNLEALFEQFVKQRKGKDGAGSSRAGSSRENN